MKVAICLAIALSLGACSSPGKAVCSKAHECCAQLSKCSDINTAGPGYEERCGITSDANQQDLATYKNKLCDAIATAQNDLENCLGGITCNDVSTANGDLGHVARCDGQARAACNAWKQANDACGSGGGDYFIYAKFVGCDNATANLSYSAGLGWKWN